jgi:pyruvate dehydrogenase E2 component (dihydrolipoamide acetyltransferase)
MATAIAMPKLGMTMTEGRVIDWSVAVGDRVEKGQVVLVIESEKAEVEVEAAVSGVLRHIYVPADTTVASGTLLGAITADADESFDAEEFRRQQQSEGGRTIPAAAAAKTEAAALSRPREALPRGAPVTPAARRRARELGLNLAAIAGSGPGGRITVEDVEALAQKRRELKEVAPGVSLEVPGQGDGETVVLLPGFGTDVSSFAPLVPVLAERYRVLGVNPRGVGLSDAPEADGYEVSASAEDVATLIPGGAHVIGASLGAAVAIELALAHPECVRSLTLLTPFVRAGARLLAVIDSWCAMAEVTGPDVLARALLPWFFSPRLLADANARERTARGLEAMLGRVPAATLKRQAAGLRAWSGTRESSLGQVVASTLVVAAGADLLVPDAHRLAEQIPRAQLVVPEHAGHAVAIEAAVAVNEAVRAHVAAVTAA